MTFHPLFFTWCLAELLIKVLTDSWCSQEISESWAAAIYSRTHGASHSRTHGASKRPQNHGLQTSACTAPPAVSFCAVHTGVTMQVARSLLHSDTVRSLPALSRIKGPIQPLATPGLHLVALPLEVSQPVWCLAHPSLASAAPNQHTGGHKGCRHGRHNGSLWSARCPSLSK